MVKHVIFGAGSLANLAYLYAKESLLISIDAIVVDDMYLEQSESLFADTPLIGWSTFCKQYPVASTKVFVAVGYKSMRARASAFSRVISNGYSCFNIQASTAYVADNVSIGFNNIFMPGVVIEPFVTIGNNNIFWSNATVCHDVIIGHNNFFASNCTIGGLVNIGDSNFFGFSSTIIQNIHVQDESLIAASSLVIKNVDSLARYQGVPAKLFATIDSSTGVCV